MHFRLLLLLLVRLAGVRSLAHSPRGAQKADKTSACQIDWISCADNTTAPTLQCASYPVPLDYTNSTSNATLNLKLLRLPATNGPSRGSILVNYGGPGDTGIPDLTILGVRQQLIVGGQYDLVLVVPRGTGDTLPFSCYSSDEARTLATLSYPTLAGNASEAAVGQQWAQSGVLAANCYQTQKENGELIGTAFLARDTMQVVDALREDGLLRYWGVSYGTLLGATIAAMFPERMDKVILDGVVNPHEYYHNYEFELLTDTDKTFGVFCDQCVAAPDLCPLARNHTSSSLQEAIYRYIESLKRNPVAVILPSGASFVLDYSTARGQLFQALYYPKTWASFATGLDGMMTGNVTEVASFLGLNSGSTTPPTTTTTTSSGGNTGTNTTSENGFESWPGIKCSDKFTRSSTLAEALPALERRNAMSKYLGDAADKILTECAQWPFAAKERYGGNFSVKTRSPLLLIGNSADPVTPLISARNASAGFEGSVVLEQNSPGHTSTEQFSLCTALRIRAYFENGTLPAPGTVCEVDVPPFGGNGWAAVAAHLNGTGK